MAEHEDIDHSGEPYHTVKDSIFRHLFEEKENLLELYRMLHPEDATVGLDDLNIVTLETIIVKGIHNDLGFMVGDKLLVLVEAQSTWTENIVVRGLMYAAKTYQNYFRKTNQSVYSTTKLQMPSPELYVVYTGKRKIDTDEINLQDSFFCGEHGMIDARMKVITDDTGDNIMAQYIRFSKILDYCIGMYGKTAEAVTETIRISKSKNALRKFLEDHEKEATDIMTTLFSQEEAVVDFGASERAAGRKEGAMERTNFMIANMIKRGDKPEDAAAIADVSIEYAQKIADKVQRGEM